jgi:hypothetical protein
LDKNSTFVAEKCWNGRYNSAGNWIASIRALITTYASTKNDGKDRIIGSLAFGL